jgi:hypothetical protein
MEKSTIPLGSMQPTATVAYWAKTQLAGLGDGQCKPEHAQGASSARAARGHRTERGQHT